MFIASCGRHRIGLLALSMLLPIGLVTPLSAQLFRRAIVIENACIVPMTGRQLERGKLLFYGETIAAIGRDPKLPMLKAVYDAEGRTVTPGLIDVASALARANTARSGSAAHVARDVFDPFATLDLQAALAAGITTVCLLPGDALGYQGTTSIIHLNPARLRAPRDDRQAAAKSPLEANPALRIDLASDASTIARAQVFSSVRERFLRALEYREMSDEYDRELAEYPHELAEYIEKHGKTVAENKGGQPAGKKAAKAPKPPRRPRVEPDLDQILAAIDGESIVRIVAHRSADILNAIALAKEFGLKLVVEGASEAHLLADELREVEARVVLVRLDLGSVPPASRRWWQTVPDLGGCLRRAGIDCYVGSGGERPTASRLLLNAQLAVAAGAANDPLRLVTRDAARLLGIEKQCGCLRRGALADVVVWNGDPLAPETTVERVYVAGELVYVRGATQ